MRHDTPSFTAASVAALRGLGALLPADARIADDPYGARFAGRLAPLIALAQRVPALGRAATWPLRHWVAYLQVRTRAIDDVLLDFVGSGGRQVVILGAGFDCRAARFARELVCVHVFEIDHPATQARKREAMAGERQADVAYLSWDFEARPLAELPAELTVCGLDPQRPTLTIWEGVTMYLSEAAIDDTLATVRQLGAPGSPIVFTYFERALLERPQGTMRAVRRLAGRVGEPYRFGWNPPDLAPWLAARGFVLDHDRSEAELASL